MVKEKYNVEKDKETYTGTAQAYLGNGSDISQDGQEHGHPDHLYCKTTSSHHPTRRPD